MLLRVYEYKAEEVTEWFGRTQKSASTYLFLINIMNDDEVSEMCEICKLHKPDVHERDDRYAQEIRGEENATHIACDKCDHQRFLDI